MHVVRIAVRAVSPSAMRVLLLVCAIGCSSAHPAALEPDGAVHPPPQPDAHLAPPMVDAADISGPTDVPAVPCTDAITAVYAATPTNAPLGAILACAPDATIALADVQTQIGVDVTATTGVAMFRIAYATRTGAGTPAVSTARVYLPHVPRARPVPIVVAGHGSVGLADSCAPSNGVDANLPLPYAGRGFAVIAPDLAGLGNASYQDYLDNRAQGWQMLDSARALRALLAPGITAPSLILSGYSQGGGAVLSAQSLIAGDGEGIGTLVATVVYAPEWPIRLNSFGYADILRDPTQLTISTGLSRSSIVVLRQFAFFENWIGAGTGPTAFDPKFTLGLQVAVDSQCLVPFGGYVQISMLHTGDLIEESLREGLVGCMDDTAACTGNAATYFQAMAKNELPPDPTVGPTLIVQGLADQIMAPANEAACILQDLQTAGSDVATCVIPTADHSNIMDNHAHGVAWAESVMAGGIRVLCDATATLPACAP